MGPEDSTGFDPFRSKPKAHAEEEEVSEDSRRESILPRTTLSSADQNHRIGRCHVAQDNPLEDHKRDSKHYGLVIGAW